MAPPEIDVGVSIVLLPRCPNTKIIPFLVKKSPKIIQQITSQIVLFKKYLKFLFEEQISQKDLPKHKLVFFD
jgi:hypothetical protein